MQGGPAAILKAYKKALPRLSIPAMLTILDRLNLKYPYHQSIGFYLSQAGYPDSLSLDILKRKGMAHRFYLDYAMDKPAFSDEWNMYFPNKLREKSNC